MGPFKNPYLLVCNLLLQSPQLYGLTAGILNNLPCLKTHLRLNTRLSINHFVSVVDCLKSFINVSNIHNKAQIDEFYKKVK